MATRILVTATFAAALCLAACSPAETSGGGQTPTESADSMSTDVRSVAIADMSKVSILTHSSTIPPWYRDSEDTDTTGVFTAGDCSNDLYYYPIRPQGDSLDAYGYFTPAAVEGIGEGILLSMVDEYATNGIEPFGLTVWVSETTQMLYPVDQVSEFYFIQSNELGANPAFAMHESPEIGLCADQNL